MSFLASLPEDAGAQTIGFLAAAIGMGAFLSKEDRHLKFWGGVSATLLAGHFALLGHAPAAMGAGVAASRAFLALSPKAKWAAPVYYGLNLLPALRADSFADALIAPAGILGTTGFFFLRGVAMRACFLGGSALWLVHNILNQSYGGVALEVGNLLMNGYRISRLRADRSAAPMATRPAVARLGAG